MFLGLNWAAWLPILTIASTLFTVAAGTLAVFQHLHTKDGKLTRFGYVLVVLILVSGASALGLGIIDRRIADERERADAAARDRQFQTQMGGLRSVTGSLSQLQNDMRGSIGQQERLFDVANRTLGMSETLQREAQTNTISVLRRLFTESNRIAAERIAVTVTYECPSPDRWRGSPIIGGAMLILNGGSRNEVRLLTEQRLSLNGSLVFHGFMGDLGSYETFPAWGSARITIRLFASDPGLDGTPLAGTLMSEFNRMTEEERRQWAAPPAPQFCPTSAALLLNGRQVLSSDSTLQQDGAGDYRAEFANLRVDQRRLPRFAE